MEHFSHVCPPYYPCIHLLILTLAIGGTLYSHITVGAAMVGDLWKIISLTNQAWNEKKREGWREDICINTSLAAPGAAAHHLKPCTACVTLSRLCDTLNIKESQISSRLNSITQMCFFNISDENIKKASWGWAVQSSEQLNFESRYHLAWADNSASCGWS